MLEMWKLEVKNLTSHFKLSLHTELSPLALSLSICWATSPLALHCPDIPSCPHLWALQQPGTSASRLPHFPFVLNTDAYSIISIRVCVHQAPRTEELRAILCIRKLLLTQLLILHSYSIFSPTDWFTRVIAEILSLLGCSYLTVSPACITYTSLFKANWNAFRQLSLWLPIKS